MVKRIIPDDVKPVYKILIDVIIKLCGAQG